MATNLRFIRASSVREGDFYIDGFQNGKSIGPEFTVVEVFRGAVYMNRTRFRGAKENEVVEVDGDRLVIVEREPKRRTR